MIRNVAVALLASAGAGLLSVAALDWISYTSFSLSLIWK